jgi:hypothetical protein
LERQVLAGGRFVVFQSWGTTLSGLPRGEAVLRSPTGRPNSKAPTTSRCQPGNGRLQFAD